MHMFRIQLELECIRHYLHQRLSEIVLIFAKTLSTTGKYVNEPSIFKDQRNCLIFAKLFATSGKYIKKLTFTKD